MVLNSPGHLDIKFFENSIKISLSIQPLFFFFFFPLILSIIQPNSLFIQLLPKSPNLSLHIPLPDRRFPSKISSMLRLGDLLGQNGFQIHFSSNTASKATFKFLITVCLPSATTYFSLREKTQVYDHSSSNRELQWTQPQRKKAFYVKRVGMD